MEAMEKLKAGIRFSEVASQYSEDKARQGVRIPALAHHTHPSVGHSCLVILLCYCTHVHPALPLPYADTAYSVFRCV